MKFLGWHVCKLLLCCADMMPALHNYVTVDMQGFASNPRHLEIIYDMCKTVSNMLF